MTDAPDLSAEAEARIAAFVEETMAVDNGVSLDIADDLTVAINEIIRLRADLAAAERKGAEAWQPIETAPETGELFPLLWLWEPHGMGGFMFAGTRNNEGEWINNIDMAVQNPTDWMPLPLPPSTREGE